jgi:hypothetical protein
LVLFLSMVLAFIVAFIALPPGKAEAPVGEVERTYADQLGPEPVHAEN